MARAACGGGARDEVDGGAPAPVLAPQAQLRPNGYIHLYTICILAINGFTILYYIYYRLLYYRV